MRPNPQLRCMQNPLLVSRTSASICWRSSLPAEAIFSNSSLINTLSLASPTGIRLLKVVSGQKPREIAAEVLNQVILRTTHHGGPEKSSAAGDKSQDFIEHKLERALEKAGLSGADRGLCQELVYGVVRWMATLGWLIAQKTNGREQKPR